MPWTPPSVKKLASWPHIVCAEPDLVQKYLDWFDANKGIPRTVPPLYQDFVIEFSRTFDGGRKHDYAEIVHYSGDLCSLTVCHVIDGKKVLTVESDYADYDGSLIRASVTAPSTTRYPEDWLKNEGVSVITTVLAVQLYILYHRPELVPVYADGQKSPGKVSASRRAASPSATIADTRRKIIRLSASDPVPRNVTYKAIQWTVRGHYRHLPPGKDGKARIIYIKPHVARRGNKKQKPMKIDMK